MLPLAAAMSCRSDAHCLASARTESDVSDMSPPPRIDSSAISGPLPVLGPPLVLALWPSVCAIVAETDVRSLVVVTSSARNQTPADVSSFVLDAGVRRVFEFMSTISGDERPPSS